MNFVGVGLSTDFVGGLYWRQIGSEVGIGVVETIGVVGISPVVADWEV